nr:MAG TPA: hypothetical protein [Caudoviricetes sp.]
MAADYSVLYQTFTVRICLLLRTKSRALYFNHLSNKPGCEFKLI